MRANSGSRRPFDGLSLGLALAERLRRVKRRPLPRHLAIIMDGNGRWAQKYGWERTVGHREGVEAARAIVEFVDRALGIKYLTLYAFSKENWHRPRPEVDFLMELLLRFLRERVDELVERNVKLRVLGDPGELPLSVQAELARALEQSRHNDGLNLSFAINYGGRQEILHAVRRLLEEVQAGRLRPEEVDEAHLRRHLYTAELPDPDLLIRTSGEQRLSNFLLWQSAYTEFWTTPTLWPDFSPQELLSAIEAYQRRRRTFGGLEGTPPGPGPQRVGIAHPHPSDSKRT